MSALLRRLLTVGAEPSDDDDTRLRKFLLLAAALAITPLAVVWGAIWAVIGPRPAQIATALPDTNPPRVHIRTNGRLTYGTNWPIANQA